MLIGIVKESNTGETRVALLPDAVKGLKAQGVEVAIENNCGLNAGASNDDYARAGGTVASDRGWLFANADIIPVVNCPPAEDLRRLKQGSILSGFLRPLDDPAALRPAIDRGATLFSMELIPRITRAQAMDTLSSMATVAGYKAVVIAADHLPRMFPLLMTAAGTVPPAKVFVIGAGVAGLQAIATARRLGALVSAYDVRAAAGEQVKSLGATFVEVDLGGIQTEDKGGYAKELSEEALNRGRDLIAHTAKTSDVIITTAQVPGRRAPLLVRRDAVEGMRRGSIILDLAAPGGGNCELTRPGETIDHNGVTIFGPLNLPATIPVHASQLYSKNMTNFLNLLVKKGVLTVDMNDEIIKGSCVAHNGNVVNERVAAVLQAASAR
ncbi:MAG TPA: Re/Si-specific NAD(P)(+) transhydrogenase subunit alpha [Terriglobales bacterium]|nr:Re/Si-specific NAD(P)(+) transhydrogenase subunit alpha [Terriglobales bacterium]